jgi:dolichol-phosphate mannosyltransferase
MSKSKDNSSLATKERTKKFITLDVIIPLFNEAAVLPTLIQRLRDVFNEHNRERYKISNITYIFVDDGCEDDSVQILRDYFKGNRNVKLIRLSRNFGQQAAITAGLYYSRSDIAAIIDADLQDPPEYILEMIKKWREGFEIVYGQRVNRKENRVKVFCYWLFYRLCGYLVPFDMALDSGDFCVMGKKAVQELNRLPEKLRFPRGLRSWVGFPQAGITYERPARAAGRSKYSFRKLYELATDGLAAMSIRPLKLAQVLALMYLLFSFVVFIIIAARILGEGSYDLDFLILLALMLLSNSIILFCIYILGAYIGRSYLESKGRPSYIVKETIDFGTDEQTYGSNPERCGNCKE